MQNKPLDVLILAAGLGTRMRSDIAKVLHKLDGRPLINHVCRTAAALAPQKVYVVVGHQGEEVRESVLEELEEEHVEFVWQKEQLGTGDAVNSARRFLEDRDSELLVLSGDVPMIKAETLAGLVRQHQSHRGKGAACTILSVEVDDPKGYGRIIRDTAGFFLKIAEQKDGNEAELKVREINAGIYCFDTRKLFDALSKVSNDNAQGEYYLTDAPRVLKDAGEPVSIFKLKDSFEIEGINDRRQLADLERSIRRRAIKRLMLDFGVTFIDPDRTYVGASVTIGRDSTIYPNVVLEGETKIGDGCVIKPGTRIANSKIGYGVEIRDNCVIEDADIGNRCTVGPMAHLRPGAVLGDGARIGNFVEVKKSVIGRNSKVNHLSYIGDATIGEDTNIGAGTITCNYDGKNKHRTNIGDRVKIGSDTMLVAPVTVGDDSVTGAGTVVTKDVPPKKLVVGAPGRAIRSLASPPEGEDG
ncbi:MAG: UDP-N-acetylglucosamine diphosphorylase/glucosamine-1-phosphate N-acetyltransferase [Acidobacteria bacterium]|nr:MAG: UDP-N-acetylglucosamine diphosphorylase/glucosamine-1-phosphate N-acetyltransferase [Acidobacteriota bacterium]REJ98903.1 MAG: UDP-N-acetylglucosamine diphosphorylase/glucosamine-1-phosphate N-acetyltransferase [Acidobacteriota bacterium]REK16377.1 MAG: UDP-N-acetylglucosamine diphosphorylase/glucosamine-1-phosphate N-acetyltransferase [Acidobacteriota bacterium]REK44058.1 MAG: UDP-N-acetylglucosamine diphosphorylase/glucosamine-1-phosphate N-acetyltransferase [Acidobacteriota bacterium]